MGVHAGLVLVILLWSLLCSFMHLHLLLARLKEPGGDWSHANLEPIVEILEKAIACGEYRPEPHGLPLIGNTSRLVCETYCRSQGFWPPPEGFVVRVKENHWG